MSVKLQISKTLSPNDVGETKSHQWGILIPKNPPKIREFFPELDTTIHNPRSVLKIKDINGKKWEFHYIYYNGELFGGTRNEYRLTRMNPFFKYYELESGDEVTFSKNQNNEYIVGFFKRRDKKVQEKRTDTIKLSNKWKIIPLMRV